MYVNCNLTKHIFHARFPFFEHFIRGRNSRAPKCINSRLVNAQQCCDTVPAGLAVGAQLVGHGKAVQTGGIDRVADHQSVADKCTMWHVSLWYGLEEKFERHCNVGLARRTGGLHIVSRVCCSMHVTAARLITGHTQT